MKRAIQKTSIPLLAVFLVTTNAAAIAGGVYEPHSEPQGTRKPSNQTILKKIQDQQRRNLGLMRDELETLAKASGETLLDIIERSGSEKISHTAKAIGGFINSYSATGSVMDRDYWAALPEVLEAAVSLLDAMFDSYPPLKLEYPTAYSAVKALATGIEAINAVDNILEARGAAERLTHLLEWNDHLQHAIRAIQERQRADEMGASAGRPQPGDHADSTGADRNSAKRKHIMDSPQSADELVSSISHKIETVSRDVGPIYLDYEGDGIPTETPPPDLQGQAPQNWLREHQDFLKAVKRRTASMSKVTAVPPRELLETGKETELSKWIAKHPKFLQRVLGNDVPPESKQGPLEVSDQEVTDLLQVPRGWVECQCPWDHPNLGVFIRDKEGRTRQFHDPAFNCP